MKRQLFTLVQPEEEQGLGKSVSARPSCAGDFDFPDVTSNPCFDFFPFCVALTE